MDAEVMLGKYSVSFVLTVLLAWAFSLIKENPDEIPNRTKRLVAVISGIGLSVLAMFYNAHMTSVQPDLPIIVDYVLSGFLVGASSIGINELMKGKK